MSVEGIVSSDVSDGISFTSLKKFHTSWLASFSFGVGGGGARWALFYEILEATLLSHKRHEHL